VLPPPGAPPSDHHLHSSDQHSRAPDPSGDWGAALVSKVRVARRLAGLNEVTIPGRVAAAVLDTVPEVAVLGMYVPSRDRGAGKTEKKERFVASLRGLEPRRGSGTPAGDARPGRPRLLQAVLHARVCGDRAKERVVGVGRALQLDAE
jgi:hypothetical protein